MTENEKACTFCDPPCPFGCPCGCHDEDHDARAAEIAALRAEVERLTYLHDLDHKLADQWHERTDKAEAEAEELKKVLGDRVAEAHLARGFIRDTEAKVERLTAALRDPGALARQFHEVYERLAPSFGYETRAETQVFDPGSKNGRLMVATCAEIARRALEKAK